MEAAKDLLKRAVELDKSEKYSEALICYEEGIQNLLRAMEGRPEAEVKDIRKRAESYLARAEEIKKRAKTEKVQSKQQVKYLHIPEGATGYSYYTIFKSCLEKGGITWVEVEDPYIRYNHQVHNFVRFCEMLVKHCLPMLKSVSLLTGVGEVIK
uniref:MIT domain-containing protein n=1 Tax=Amphimedon queenslandica TaxID=400682 RepID=A0A1X7VPJ3_AMPQE